MVIKAQESFVSIRMYKVGFGDCFLVRVQRFGRIWKMIVDCGVHRQGIVNPISRVVDKVIADISDEDGNPSVDVIVATHHHEDHISGFSFPAWEPVAVKEVWLPFVEDAKDADAQTLRQSHENTANSLSSLIDEMSFGIDATEVPEELRAARAFALNSSRNRDAADRLLGRNGKSFAGNPKIRFLPYLATEANVISIDELGGRVHILGPSRHPARLKAMRPPQHVGWLRFDRLGEEVNSRRIDSAAPLFNSQFEVSSQWMPDHIRSLRRAATPSRISETASVLMAASILERVVNNTSLFFVLEIGEVKLLFPGDAQHGAWEHVLSDSHNRRLLENVSLYKVGHHGSHNGTSKRFVEEVWNKGAAAILPWGLVPQWKDTIPKRELIAGLNARGHAIINDFHSNSEIANFSTRDADLWTEISFPL